MSPRTKKQSPKEKNPFGSDNVKTPKKGKRGVQNLSDYVQGEQSAQLSSLDGQTIYVVKLQPMQSDTFGAGFKIWYKELPNAAETLQAHTFGMVTVPVLDQLYRNTNEGRRISLDSPVKITVVVNGRTTTLS